MCFSGGVFFYKNLPLSFDGASVTLSLIDITFFGYESCLFIFFVFSAAKHAQAMRADHEHTAYLLRA
jgi:hypothetical protein